MSQVPVKNLAPKKVVVLLVKVTEELPNVEVVVKLTALFPAV
jgi:hypothetical protein